MIEITLDADPPEVTVRISGSVSADQFHEAVRLSGERAILSPGAVVLVEYIEASSYDPEAAGVLLFLMDDLLDRDPHAVLVVNPTLLDTTSSSTRKMRERNEQDSRVHFLSTRAEADAFIDALGAAPEHPEQ